MNFCEPWIEKKLRERLELYQKRYPTTKIERVIEQVKLWEPENQRFAPYMKDTDIQRITKGIRKSRSLESLCKNEHL